MGHAPDTLVIVNPKSQGGRVGKDWPGLAPRIRRHFAFEERFTEHPLHATALARQAIGRGVERIIAVGGDGTFNEVAGGCFVDAASATPLAVAHTGAHGSSGRVPRVGLLPLGTGGDFRRTFGLPTDLEAAAKVIAADHTRCIDVGRLTYRDADGRTAQRLFANIASFGLSGQVVRKVNDSGKKLGRLSFALATLSAAVRYDNARVHLVFDDDAAGTVDLTASTVAVANARYFGGGMKVAPDAEPDDGQFDVVCIGDLGTLAVLLKGTRMYKGTHVSMPEVSVRRARTVDASAVGETPVYLDCDGENVGQLPARFELVPAALHLIVPATPPI